MSYVWKMVEVILYRQILPRFTYLHHTMFARSVHAYTHTHRTLRPFCMNNFYSRLWNEISHQPLRYEKYWLNALNNITLMVYSNMYVYGGCFWVCVIDTDIKESIRGAIQTWRHFFRVHIFLKIQKEIPFCLRLVFKSNFKRDSE